MENRSLVPVHQSAKPVTIVRVHEVRLQRVEVAGRLTVRELFAQAQAAAVVYGSMFLVVGTVLALLHDVPLPKDDLPELNIVALGLMVSGSILLAFGKIKF